MAQRAVEDGFEQAILQFYSEPQASVLNITVWRPFSTSGVNKSGSGKSSASTGDDRDNLVRLLSPLFHPFSPHL